MSQNETNINEQDEDGFCPIHMASANCGAKNSHLKELIERGADIEAKDKFCRTALHWACHSGNHHLVKFLLSKGAKANISDNEGYTPIFMAVEGCNAAIKILVEAGADIEHQNNNRLSPLTYACKIGKVGAIKSLCELGADANVDKYSDKSLVWLVIHSFKSVFPSNALQMVRMLLKSGATVGGRDVATGQTELHILAELSNTHWKGDKYAQIMKVVINASCDPWQVDSNGLSPLTVMKDEYIEDLSPALKKFIKGREKEIARKTKTVSELKALYFNQNKITKEELFGLLPEESEAKLKFHETLQFNRVIDV